MSATRWGRLAAEIACFPACASSGLAGNEGDGQSINGNEHCLLKRRVRSRVGGKGLHPMLVFVCAAGMPPVSRWSAIRKSGHRFSCKGATSKESKAATELWRFHLN
jgi:hypothetical protein